VTPGRKPGRVDIEGAQGEQVIIWPVFIPGLAGGAIRPRRRFHDHSWIGKMLEFQQSSSVPKPRSVSAAAEGDPASPAG